MLTRSDLRRFAACLLLCTSPLANAADVQIDELMQVLARTRSGQATFIEKKYIGIIDKPVESSGELAFTAPDKLEKRTLKPKQENILVDGDSLLIEHPGKRRLSLSLQSYPEVAGFVDSIRATLAGDRTALDKTYVLSLSGSADKWELILKPRFSRMSEIISRISIRGIQGDIRSINFDLADGDRSEMTITKASLQ